MKLMGGRYDIAHQDRVQPARGRKCDTELHLISKEDLKTAHKTVTLPSQNTPHLPTLCGFPGLGVSQGDWDTGPLGKGSTYFKIFFSKMKLAL